MSYSWIFKLLSQANFCLLKKGEKKYKLQAGGAEHGTVQTKTSDIPQSRPSNGKRVGMKGSTVSTELSDGVRFSYKTQITPFYGSSCQPREAVLTKNYSSTTMMHQEAIFPPLENQLVLLTGLSHPQSLTGLRQRGQSGWTDSPTYLIVVRRWDAAPVWWPLLSHQQPWSCSPITWNRNFIPSASCQDSTKPNQQVESPSWKSAPSSYTDKAHELTFSSTCSSPSPDTATYAVRAEVHTDGWDSWLNTQVRVCLLWGSANNP